MEVELLYFDDCPSWQSALEALRAVLDGLDVTAEVKLVRVESDSEAQRARFVGSPTIRVGGEDLFPTGNADYALGCRLYVTPEGLNGWPSVDMLHDALSGRV